MKHLSANKIVKSPWAVSSILWGPWTCMTNVILFIPNRHVWHFAGLCSIYNIPLEKRQEFNFLQITLQMDNCKLIFLIYKNIGHLFNFFAVSTTYCCTEPLVIVDAGPIHIHISAKVSAVKMQNIHFFVFSNVTVFSTFQNYMSVVDWVLCDCRL